MNNIRRGLNIVFTGDGKGKTTAAIGLALRAAGQRLNVLIIQFMKGQSNIGELKALDQCHLPIEIKRFGRPGFVQSRACEPLDIYLANEGLKCFRSAVLNSHYELVVLDEIFVAIDFGLLKSNELNRILKIKPPDLHVVLTGRSAPSNIINTADIVTEMKEIYHPFSLGMKAQAGIEF